MNDITSRTDIETLVDTFYQRVRSHEELGPIFNNNIGNLWFLHLDTMYRFWETLLLSKDTYSGSPFPKHTQLELKERHFDQWLEVFTKTVNDLFEGPTANAAKRKGGNILQSFKLKYPKKKRTNTLF